MRLSFVIPTRNQARFIGKCLDQCLAQNITDSEIIVVDGLSTDHTVEVLQSYGDRITFTSERDSGQSDAIDKGIGRARGDVIAWINSDDYYPRANVLERVLAAFDGDPRNDIVYGRGEMVDVDGKALGPYPVLVRPTPRDIVIRGSSGVLQPAVFFRRSLYKAVGGLDHALHYTMDYDLWIRMFERARAVEFLPEVLACATYHPDAKSVRTMRKQIIEAARVKSRHAAKLGLGPIDRARMLANVASMFAYWGAVRLGLKRAV
ncbi:MAG: glycosyltransferase family 2 protein [Kofleriaceae bacterium]